MPSAMNAERAPTAAFDIDTLPNIAPIRPSKQSVFGDFGCVHIGLIRKLETLSYRDARRHLKDLWMTKGEQDELIHLAAQAAGKPRGKTRQPVS